MVPPKHFRNCRFGAGHRGIYLPNALSRIMARNDWTSPDLAEIVSRAYAFAHCHEQKFPMVVNLLSLSSYLMGK
jgi:Lhr-like helicase